MIDLHIHTDASSDGVHKPVEIFKMAATLGLEAIAFADHNSMANVARGMELARKSGIRFISGMELNTQHEDHDLHVLAYGFDPNMRAVAAWLESIEKGKWDQARGRTDNLKRMGFIFEWEDVISQCGNKPPSGMNFLKAMLARRENDKDHRLDPYRLGGSRSNSPYLNFYLDYLRGGKPAFYPMEGVDSVQVIRQIIELDAIPILAHPSDTPDEFIPALLDAGLMGLEVYSTYHDAALIAKWLNVAQSNELLITAGSDFHGKDIKPDVLLANIPHNTIDLFNRLMETLVHRGGIV